MILLLWVVAAPSLQADPGAPARPTGWAQSASDTTTDVAVALGLCLSATDENGEAVFREVGDATLWTGILTVTLKYLVGAPRPDDPHARDGFPSGHASLAFSLATALADRYPDLAPVWYGWAGTVAASRVELRRHSVLQAAAGALLGILTARWASHGGHSVVAHLVRPWRWGSAECRFLPTMQGGGIALLEARW